ncbi:CLYBL isoform 6, partial [Pan troglodytes]
NEARLRIVKTLEDFDLGPTEKCVRVNSVSSGLAEEDLETLLQSRVLPSSLMLPKVESPEEIQWFADKFSFHLKGRKLEQPMNLIPFVETAMGLLNFKAVCEETLKVGPQVGLFLDAVVFGGEDFRASIGVKDISLSLFLCVCVYMCVYIFSLPLKDGHLHNNVYLPTMTMVFHDNGMDTTS